MSAPSLQVSTQVSVRHENMPAATAARGVLAERWPTLARAMSRYQEETAERFTAMAYDVVVEGVIRLEERQKLAAAASAMGIRAFDAQLLIACAVRQWAMDRRYDASPNPTAPRLSFEYKSWGRAWLRFGMLVGLAAMLDGVIIWKWLS